MCDDPALFFGPKMKTYEQLSARIKELEQGIIDLQLMIWGTDEPKTPFNRLPEAKQLFKRLMKDDEFLSKVRFLRNGRYYYATGKVGNRLSDGMMGREFKSEDDSRCWLYRDLSIEDD